MCIFGFYATTHPFLILTMRSKLDKDPAPTLLMRFRRAFLLSLLRLSSVDGHCVSPWGVYNALLWNASNVGSYIPAVLPASPAKT